MKILKTFLFAVSMLMFTNVSMADNANFAGPYIGFNGTAIGADFEGRSDGNAGDTDTIEQVMIGRVALISGAEAGYVLPMGDSFAIDVGGVMNWGSAKIKSKSDSGRGNVTMEIQDHWTAYIAPTIALTDTSSAYLKWGLSEADVTVTGDVTAPGNLSGETFAIGMRTVLDSGIFVRTEAGYTDYNEISSIGKGAASGNDAIPTTTRYSADPSAAYGMVSIGFRF